jgi:protein-S-isoprenylcysteine O-methyltransferase Ste14
VVSRQKLDGLANRGVLAFTIKAAIAVVTNAVIFALLLLVPARTLDWPRAWVTVALTGIGTAVMMLAVLRHDEGLLDERFRLPIQRGQPLADKILLAPLIVGFCAAVAFIPCDVFRLHLLPAPSNTASLMGLALAIAGWSVTILALKENSFAAPVVKYQQYRGQRVVASGVYGVVRHPMYSGAALFLIGLALWLGSYAGAIVMLAPIATLGVRIIVEERFLHGKLAGYDAYAKRVRYRLIPLVW